MINRGTEDHKIWLFDLAHGNLKDDQLRQSKESLERVIRAAAGEE